MAQANGGSIPSRGGRSAQVQKRSRDESGDVGDADEVRGHCRTLTTENREAAISMLPDPDPTKVHPCDGCGKDVREVSRAAVANYCYHSAWKTTPVISSRQTLFDCCIWLLRVCFSGTAGGAGTSNITNSINIKTTTHISERDNMSRIEKLMKAKEIPTPRRSFTSLFSFVAFTEQATHMRRSRTTQNRT